MQDANQQEHKLYVGRLWFDKHGDILLQNYKIEEKCKSFILVSSYFIVMVWYSFLCNSYLVLKSCVDLLRSQVCDSWNTREIPYGVALHIKKKKK